MVERWPTFRCLTSGVDVGREALVVEATLGVVGGVAAVLLPEAAGLDAEAAPLAADSADVLEDVFFGGADS